jgi:ABC-2 type transport system permease protein
MTDHAAPDAVIDPPADRPAVASRALSTPRPFYWSVRRELWENRSIYIAPLAVAGLILFGFVISAFNVHEMVNGVAILDPTENASLIAAPYSIAAAAVMATAFAVAIFYCVGALYNERRDRSILFWKSLPVSDLTTVLSKVAIPMAVLPLVAFAVTVGLQLVMIVVNTGAVMAGGFSAPALWSHLPLVQMEVVLLYGLIALALWFAPFYGWLLLVSGWARKAPFLWAFLPPLALCLAERIAFHSSYLASLLWQRLTGGISAAFNGSAAPGAHLNRLNQLAQMDPVRFITTPGLWLGLVFAAACLAAAVWLRQRREPI